MHLCTVNKTPLPFFICKNIDLRFRNVNRTNPLQTNFHNGDT